MAIRPPFFARVALGAVVVVLEEARKLPITAVDLPMNAMSRLLQASMHTQQFLTSLAIKGDNALESLNPIPEEPEWVTFYENNGDPSDDGHGEVPHVTDTNARARAEDRVDEASTLDNDPASPRRVEVVTRINYPSLSLAQLRARLRNLSVEDLTELLAYEQAEQARAPFLTMLSNRIAATTAR